MIASPELKVLAVALREAREAFEVAASAKHAHRISACQRTRGSYCDVCSRYDGASHGWAEAQRRVIARVLFEVSP